MLKLSQATLRAVLAVLLSCSMSAISFGQVPGAGEVQTWLDDTLKFKIEAKFRGMEGDMVKLETSDGQIKKIPYNKLSLSSQLKVKKITDPKLFEAPPLPSAFSAPPVSDSPFTPEDTIEKYLETFNQKIKAGNADVLWHALPPQPRADLEATIVKTAEILGNNTFKQMQVVLPNLHTVVRDKRSFIVNSQSISAVPTLSKSLNQILPAIEPLVGVLTKPSTWNSENFKEGKVGPWLMLFANDGLGAAKSMLVQLKTIFPNEEIPDFEDITNYKITAKTADSATVEFVTGKKKDGTPLYQAIQYKKVDGYWITTAQETMFAQWAKGRAEIENLDQAGRDQMKNSARQALTTANTVLGALAKAKSQQEFNQLFDPLAAEAVKLIQMFGPGAQSGMGPGMGPGGMSGFPGAPSGGPPGVPRKSIADGLSGVGGK